MPQDQHAHRPTAATKPVAIAVPLPGPAEQLRMLAKQQPGSVLQVLSQWLQAGRQAGIQIAKVRHGHSRG